MHPDGALPVRRQPWCSMQNFVTSQVKSLLLYFCRQHEVFGGRFKRPKAYEGLQTKIRGIVSLWNENIVKKCLRFCFYFSSFLISHISMVSWRVFVSDNTITGHPSAVTPARSLSKFWLFFPRGEAANRGGEPPQADCPGRTSSRGFGHCVLLKSEVCKLQGFGLLWW